MVVGVTSLIGAVSAHRAGTVLLGRGVAFGLVAIGGAAVGAKASALVSDAVLLAAFAMHRPVVAAPPQPPAIGQGRATRTARALVT